MNRSLTASVAGLFTVAVLLGALPGCSSSSGSTSGVSGEYTGVAQGIGGDVTVTITLEDSVITNVVAEGPNETEGIGTKALEALPGEMVEGNTINVDIVSTATITSNAIKEAAAAALEAAGLNPDDYQTAVTSDEEAEDITEDVDVVVVGAGGAGMTAAIVAADEGKSVVILESQSVAGGNSVRSTGGMNAAKTEYEDENEFGESAGVESTLASAAEKYADNETITALASTVQDQWDAYQANPDGYFDSVELFELDTLIGGKGVNDPELVATLAENSADSIDWLSSIGADLNNVAQFGGASVKRIHRPVNDEGKVVSVGSYIVPILESTVEDRGVEIIYNATANEILVDEDGAAVGVVAEGSEGNTITINASAVVIATGGFGANNEMVAEQNSALDGYITTNADGAQGQGIEIATAIGADTVDMDQIQLHPTVHVDDDGNAHLITEGLRGDGAILVNNEGERFTNEVGTRDVVSAAENEQTDGYVWLIIDQDMADASTVIQGYINNGYTKSGNTYEELADEIGVDATTFAATMAAWNTCVENEEDAEYGRTSFADQLDAAPYYAIKVQPGVHHTMGGLKINSNTEVLDKDGNAIAGLFAAGEVTGGVHGANRLGGNAVADFVVFGRIAGQAAADYAE